MKEIVFFLWLIATFCKGEAVHLSEEENEKLQAICGLKLINSTWPTEETQPNGKYARKILNGVPVSREENPWSVLILTKSLCSGTIVSPRHILTARHCLERVRSNYRTQCDDRGNEIWTGCPNCIRIELHFTEKFASETVKVIAFGKCDSKEHTPDAALIELAREITFSDELKPVCIPVDRRLEEVGREVQINGFSNNGEGPFTLRTGYSQITRVFNSKFQLIDKRKKHVVYSGDSGGNGIVHIDRKDYIVGIISRVGSTYDSYLASVGMYTKEICRYTGICP